MEDSLKYHVHQHWLGNSFSSILCLAQASFYLCSSGKQDTAGSSRLAFVSTTNLRLCYFPNTLANMIKVNLVQKVNRVTQSWI